MTINSLKDALKVLQIEDFEERIIHSSSRGELFHIIDYISLAKSVEEDLSVATEVEVVIRDAVSYAEKHWKRPESVFQHLREMFQ